MLVFIRKKLEKTKVENHLKFVRINISKRTS